MKIYVVFCNGEIYSAFEDYSNAVKLISEMTNYSINYVEHQLVEIGNVDDFYYIETTNLY